MERTIMRSVNTPILYAMALSVAGISQGIAHAEDAAFRFDGKGGLKGFGNASQGGEFDSGAPVTDDENTLSPAEHQERLNREILRIIGKIHGS
jgi:hypothetical protein